jgi:hypothetical protein
MAETKTGLPDPASINQYGADPADVAEYQKSLADSVKALEQRYAQPNWFNVAAGFLKPQLGGFGASLGSASQALGENIEKQRESALPIAQMRAQLAASKIAMGQRASVADMMAKRQPNEPLTPEFVAEVTARAPGSSIALALKDQLATQQAQRSLASSEQGNAIQRVTLARSMGQEPNPADMALITAGSPTAKAVEPSAGTPAGAEAPAISSSTPAAAIPYTGTALPPDTLKNLQNAAAAGDTQAADVLRAYNESPVSKVPKKEEPLPQTVKIPNAKDMPDPKRQEAVSASVLGHAQDLEKVSKERYTNLTAFTSSENLPAIQSASKTALSMMDEDPKRAARVLNLVRKAGPVAAAFNAGVSAQLSSGLGSVGGSMSFPVEAWLKAGLSPDDQAYADKLTNALMTLKAAGVKLSSVSPTALVNHPSALGSVQSMNFDMGQTPAALYNSVKHFQINQDFLKDYTTLFNEESKRVDPSSLAKFTDAFDSPKLKKLAESYEAVHSALDKSYTSGLAKRKQ